MEEFKILCSATDDMPMQKNGKHTPPLRQCWPSDTGYGTNFQLRQEQISQHEPSFCRPSLFDIMLMALSCPIPIQRSPLL